MTNILSFSIALSLLVTFCYPSAAGECLSPGEQIDTNRQHNIYSDIGTRLLLLRSEDDQQPYLVEPGCLLLNNQTFWFDRRRTAQLFFAVVNFMPAGSPSSAAILVQGLRSLPATEPLDKLNVYRNEGWLDETGNTLPEFGTQRLTPGTTMDDWNAAHLANAISLKTSNEFLGLAIHAWLAFPSISSWHYRPYLRTNVAPEEALSGNKTWLTTELIRFGVNTTSNHKSLIPFHLGIDGYGDLQLKITSTLSDFDQNYTIRIE